MTRILIIEHGDQDRHGIDTVLMVVPNDFDKKDAFDNIDLINPRITNVIHFADREFDPLVALGEYRPFMG